jgi:hypothetical protein
MVAIMCFCMWVDLDVACYESLYDALVTVCGCIALCLYMIFWKLPEFILWKVPQFLWGKISCRAWREHRAELRARLELEEEFSRTHPLQIVTMSGDKVQVRCRCSFG